MLKGWKFYVYKHFNNKIETMLTEEKRNISKVLSPEFEPEIKKKKKKTGKNKTILWAPLTYPWKPIHYEEKGGK